MSPYITGKINAQSCAAVLCHGAASHIEYLVTTHSRLPGWSSSDMSVRRRFRDFVTLADLLKVGAGHQTAGHWLRLGG